jgi:hypothetical protein
MTLLVEYFIVKIVVIRGEKIEADDGGKRNRYYEGTIG